MLGISPFLFHVFFYSICTLLVPSLLWSRLDDEFIDPTFVNLTIPFSKV